MHRQTNVIQLKLIHSDRLENQPVKASRTLNSGTLSEINPLFADLLIPTRFPSRDATSGAWNVQPSTGNSYFVDRDTVFPVPPFFDSRFDSREGSQNSLKPTKAKPESTLDKSLQEVNLSQVRSFSSAPSWFGSTIHFFIPGITPLKSELKQRDEVVRTDRGIVPIALTERPIVTEQARSSAYNSTYGYGVVNAAAAVAQAIGSLPFGDVVDLGGIDRSKDQVNAPEAWAQGFRGAAITVAVIDSGVDTDHPDLAANIWYNSDEVFGDGIDNDANGYVDDITGWNFGANSSNVLDSNGHGTHVAGIIAADDNGFGVTGIAPDALIMPIKIGDVDPITNAYINPGNLGTAIRYAVDNGAKVINLSLSWTPSADVVQALAYAARQGVVTVSAAGNSSGSLPSFPAQYATDYGLSVGAIDSSNRLANFSNRAGSNPRLQHVVAPGVEVNSTLPPELYGVGYGGKQGTSMAAPHVAGVVALMLSANPLLTSNQVRSILTDSATSLA